MINVLFLFTPLAKKKAGGGEWLLIQIQIEVISTLLSTVYKATGFKRILSVQCLIYCESHHQGCFSDATWHFALRSASLIRGLYVFTGWGGERLGGLGRESCFNQFKYRETFDWKNYWTQMSDRQTVESKLSTASDIITTSCAVKIN